MAATAIRTLFDWIRELQILSPHDVASLESRFPHDITDLEMGVRWLIAQNQITLFQGRKLFHGRGHELNIGPYLLLDKLGEGGMGRVYKAQQRRLDRLVALKIMRSQWVTNPTILHRFRREAQTAASLDHPNLVRLLDADQISGCYLLVMEYVAGQDLAQIIKRRGPMRPKWCVRYARQIAMGLQHAHERGIVHRDIKPSNLMIAMDEQNRMGDLKILDMGLARPFLEDANDPEVTALTKEGRVLGTPDYMAPEQAKNSRGVDWRGDLYSLGCTMFFMLTGQPPFPKETAMEKLVAHQLELPPRLTDFDPNIPVELDAIVQRLLEKSPDRRYPHAAALLAAFDQLESSWTRSTGSALVIDLTGSELSPEEMRLSSGSIVLPDGSAITGLGGDSLSGRSHASTSAQSQSAMTLPESPSGISVPMLSGTQLPQPLLGVGDPIGTASTGNIRLASLPTPPMGMPIASQVPMGTAVASQVPMGEVVATLLTPGAAIPSASTPSFGIPGEMLVPQSETHAHPVATPVETVPAVFQNLSQPDSVVGDIVVPRMPHYTTARMSLLGQGPRNWVIWAGVAAAMLAVLAVAVWRIIGTGR
ncbi:serine/threonine protein kinase [Tuwongella immobilis]|uniref:Protein kinase domain-containing protein n=1 Tax=Tuwongella immobilis TaxID=692036 RepID=A0A6C2YIQ7_9BACT|nr:serine/threonine-protein kinase [Tuwongella immobilis]VIP01428.1 serine threonine protein kinase : Serine/threonine protein kinase OS=Singulisphaera acidiphila (strain ATCC BAA-1392 / DSM 18658 / VKM B-2454 / MOB10) GN=Sinac_2851 PE=3 SV=1: Pkinase [Tuwongella immobilis]VTR98376.1 serine threonine protein kinase : Serine/threonine protein kinase OS=Singulisphaera acidiphila (strain ATCC BAA-1392 / DSM 18658 / VKM B-2454 / MOB10) GN=Sinac_2851 PE=3 SV=1: Pkinase [Tuwongella immobilis]